MQKVLSLFGMTVPLQELSPLTPGVPLSAEDKGRHAGHGSHREGESDRPTYTYDNHHNLIQVEYPDSSRQTYTYDDRHNMIRHQSAEGRTRYFTYDHQQRLRTIADDQGILATYTIGSNFTRLSTATCCILIQYDPQKRPLKISQTIQGVTLHTEYAYNETGQCSAIRLPGSSQWLYYDTDDQHSTGCLRAEDGTVYMTSASVSSNNPMPFQENCELEDLPQAFFLGHRLEFANGVREEREFDLTKQIQRIAIAASDQEQCIDLSYQFNPQLQIEQIGDNRLQYDSEGRLIQIQNNSFQTNYSYDNRSNRLTTHTSEEVIQYQYDACDRLLTRQSIPRAADPPQPSTIRYAYDRDGNRIRKLTSDVLTEYRYDSNGQLAEVWQNGERRVQYYYDALGRRIQSIAGEMTSFYYYDLNGQLLAETDEQGQVRATYLWWGIRCLGRIDGTVGQPAASFYHTDHLGTARAVSDRQGALISYPWQPFGETGSPLFFRKFRDDLTGLYDFGARDYDPESGRFLTPDPYTFAPDDWRLLLDPQRDLWGDRPSPQAILDQWQTHSQLQNRYTFCLNDPANYLDLDGHSAWWFFLTIPLSLSWGMFYTTLALILVVLNLVMEIIGWIIFPFMCLANNQWAVKHYPWGKSNPANPFNPDERAHFWLALTASARLGVPWTILNGSFFVWRPFTLGNVVFIQSSDDNGHAGDTISRFVVPNDIDTQLNRQNALRNHEMQHTFQYNMLGPLFLIPVYLISLIRGQENSYFERNAGANSGDVYKTVVEAEKDSLYVGQFTRIVGTDTVSLPPGVPTTVTFAITPVVPVGSATASGNLNPNTAPHQINLNAHNTAPVQAQNGSAFYFHALQPGIYTVEGTGSSSGKTESVKIKVKDIEIKLKNEVFICENQAIKISGDKAATYSLNPKNMNSGGTVNGMIYTAGNIAGIDTIEIMAQYQPTLDVFKTYGDNGLVGHNYIVKTITITVKEPTITLNSSEVFVGGVVTFTIDHPPTSADINRPALVPGSQFNLSNRQFTAGKGPIAAEVTEVVTINYRCKSYPFNIKVKPITAVINPATVNGGETSQITVTGGVSPYRYTVSVPNSNRPVVDGTGRYTAGSKNTQVVDTITITDRNGEGGRARVQVTVRPMTVAINPVQVAALGTANVTVQNGVSPFSYSIINRESQGSSINSSGRYTAGTTPGMDTIQVTDSCGTQLTVSIQVTG